MKDFQRVWPRKCCRNGTSRSVASDCASESSAFHENLNQICSLQIGGFNTNVIQKATVLPESPAYNDEASPFTALRNFITGPGSKSQGDPNKFAKTIYSLVESGNIPLHLPIGKDALEMAKEVAELREKEISRAVPWSTDLLRDDL